MNISDIRSEYVLKSLDPKEVQIAPMDQFKLWFDEAVTSKVLEVNAMTLATVKPDGRPNSRIVLLKGIDTGIVFFTNYESAKGVELEKNPYVAVTFFWPELERQVRISGTVSKVSKEESDVYFHSRPYSSQIGAIVSPQSREIKNREILEQWEADLLENSSPESIKRPEHWGGYRIIPIEFEFWQGRSSRLHDRVLYTFEESGHWRISRLAP